ncbi:MAG: rod-binding protein [Sandaracinaceae bacterium]
MTVALASLLPTVAAESAPTERDAEIAQASRQFEALLLQQLVSVMRSTAGGEGGLFSSGAGSQMYAHLFDQSFADAMSAGGGVGIGSVLARSMGGRAYGVEGPQGMGLPIRPGVVPGVAPTGEVRPPSGTPLVGATSRLQAVAREMLGPTGLAPQWGRDGRLSRADLGSTFSTEGPDGVAHFNVADANGFQDRYKCNLFAFEMARRAGFQVPLIGRPRGWGFMGPNGVAHDAENGRLRADWGRIATGESAESLDASIVRGERAFVINANSTGDRRGHMGVIERVHSIDYDDQGRIRRIEFDGWEGRVQGAMHLTRRVWARPEGRRADGTRGYFDRIDVIELRRPAAGAQPETPTHRNARPSVVDTRELAGR